MRVLQNAQPFLGRVAAKQTITEIAKAVEVQGAREDDPGEQDQEGNGQRVQRELH